LEMKSNISNVLPFVYVFAKNRLSLQN